MDNYPEFTTSLQAINRAREIVKGKFSLDTEEGAEVTEVEQACIQAFYAYWDNKVHPLGTKTRYLLIRLFKAARYQPKELVIEPGLSI